VLEKLHWLPAKRHVDFTMITLVDPEPPNLVAAAEFRALAEYQPKKIRLSRIAGVASAVIRLCSFISPRIQQNCA